MAYKYARSSPHPPFPEPKTFAYIGITTQAHRNNQDISSASLYLIAKLSANPKSPRSILNVYAYLCAQRSTFPAPTKAATPYDVATQYLSESSYHALRTKLTAHEALILRTIGFQTHVALPHTLCINYLQALDAIGPASPADAGLAKELAQRAIAHLNTALLSPQLLYATHQPAALATAAIYLAAREVGIKLPEDEWWVVFDTDREELGFLVVAMNSMSGFVEEEKRRWGETKVPLTVDEMKGEIERRELLNAVE